MIENPNASAFTLEAPRLRTGNMNNAMLCCILGQGSLVLEVRPLLTVLVLLFGQKVKLVKFDWEEEKKKTFSSY